MCFIKLKERPVNFPFSYILKRKKPNSVLCLQCLEDQHSFQLSHPFFVTIGREIIRQEITE